MKAAASLDAWLTHPIGRYCEGATYVAWCAAADLVGLSSMGLRTSSESEEVVRAFTIVAHPDLRPPISILMDYRRLQGVAPEAYAIIAAFLSHMQESLLGRLRRVVMMVPPSQVGASLAGTAAVSGYSSVLVAVGSEPDAFEELGHAHAPEAAAEVERLVAARDGKRDVINGVRALLRLKPRGQSIALAASELAVSTRTLQRELKTAGTTFTRELHAARAAFVAHALAHSGDKVTAIASAAGFSSPSQMAGLFRRFYNVGPSEYRRDHGG